MRSTAEIDKEWLRLKPQIAKIKGDRCFYCGNKAEEYHHIVPRHMGGDNRLENIVPMCTECHRKAHSKRSYRSHGKWGRKEIPKPENFDEIADLYLDNHITLLEAFKMSNLKKNTFYKLLGEYQAETGDTRKHRNKGNTYKNTHKKENSQ